MNDFEKQVEVVPPPETTRELASLSGYVGSAGLPVSARSVQLNNFIVAKSGPANLFGMSILSTKASAQFIQVFDAAGLPADGAVPNIVFTVGASSNLGIYYGSVGRWFDIGIVVCNSSTSATKTIGAADTWFDVQYV